MAQRMKKSIGHGRHGHKTHECDRLNSFLHNGLDSETLNEFLCKLCGDQFGEGLKCPRVLFCGHCFCQSCIERHITESPICPLCSEKFKYKDVEQFPVNYTIVNLLKRYRRILEKKKEDLGLKPIENQNALSVLITKHFCQEHGKRKQFKCGMCRDWVCYTCLPDHHSKICETAKLRESVKEFKNSKNLTHTIKVLKLMDDKYSCKDVKDIFDHRTKNLEKDIEQYQSNLKMLEEKFQEFFTASRRKKFWTPLTPIKVPSNPSIETKETSSIFLNLNFDSNIKNQGFNSITKNNLTNPRISPSSSKLDFQIGLIKNWINDDMTLYAVRSFKKDYQFSLIEFKNNQIRIHSFQANRPRHPFIIISFRKLLLSLTKSSKMPRKAFFEVGLIGDTKCSDVIVNTDAKAAGSPRVQNFLLLMSGIKGPTYKGSPFTLGKSRGENKPFYVGVKATWKKGNRVVTEAVVKGIRNYGVYGDNSAKRGFVCGLSAEINSSLVSFSLENSTAPSMLVGKFGEVESGLEVFDQVMVNKQNNLEVKDCGIIIG